MGKKNEWFYAVKKAISCEAKENKDQRAYKSKKKWFRKQKLIPSPPPPPPLSFWSFNVKDVKIIEVEVDKNTNDYISGTDTTVKYVCFDKSREEEEEAIIKIQTAFRKYLSRKAMRGLVRLKSLIQSLSVQTQAASALNHMHTLAYVQSRNKGIKMRMSEQNQAFYRQLQQRHENEANNIHQKEAKKSKPSVGESWNLSRQSKEEIEARQLNRQTAALRREKALAYASSHQKTLKRSSKSKNQTHSDPHNLQYLSWSWLKQWMADRPWDDDIQTSITKTYADTSNHISLEDMDSGHNLNQINLKTRPPFRDLTSKISRPPMSKSLVRAQSELIGKYSSGGWYEIQNNKRYEITKKGSTKSTQKLLSFPTSLTLPRHSSGPH